MHDACAGATSTWSDRILTVRFSKTEAGERVIPLNTDAMAAILELFKRAALKLSTWVGSSKLLTGFRRTI